MGREPLRIEARDEPLERLAADVVAIPVAEGAGVPISAAGLDAAVGGRLSRIVTDGELRGRPGDLVVLHPLLEGGPARIAAVGIGAEPDRETVRTAAGRVAAAAGKLRAATIAWPLDGLPSLDREAQARSIADGTVLGGYDPGRWKTEDAEGPPPGTLLLAGSEAASALEDARRAATVAAWTNRCRDLVNAPANELTPVRLAERAGEIAAGSEHLAFSALDRDEIERAGMGAFAAVARGSETEPRLIALDYRPASAPAGEVVLGLVGKAVTFDAGGISLKPAARMEEMKADMAGGAAVLCALGALAELEVPLRAHALVPAAENMPSGRATRPGDIVTALDGKTIEITNTDAEGRLLLADALVEARRRGATRLLDVATLTGGVVVALGDYYAGLMGNDPAWLETVEAAARESGDHAWRLPVHETYKRYLKSAFADLRNSSGQRYAQPVYAASFLAEFAGDVPWAHLDIAGTGSLERGRGDVYAQKGATGYGVRLIADLAQRLASPQG